MKRIKTDISTFENLIKNECIYVDKTDFVWKLVGSGIFFITSKAFWKKSAAYHL